MGRKLKITLAVIFAVPAVAVLSVLWYIGTPYFSARIGTWLTHKSGRNIALNGTMETHLWSLKPRFIFRDVQIGNADWSKTPTMFEAKKIDVTVDLLPLLHFRLEIPKLILDQPKLLLEKNEQGKANWEMMQNPQAQVIKKPLPDSRGDVPLLGDLVINDGELNYKDPKENISTTLKVSSVTGTAARAELHLEGTGDYQHKPFKLLVSGASVLELREESKPYPFSIKTTIGDTSADVKGTVQDPVKLEALDVELDLKGANAADLFPITGIALPPTPNYAVDGHLVREGKVWKFENFKGHMGTSDIKGSLSWDTGKKPPFLNGQFISDSLDMKDLAGFIGADKKPADPNRVLPDSSLDISRMTAMNADVTFHGRHVKAPDMLDDFFMHVTLDNGTLTLHPVSFSIADGKIDADVKIEGQKKPTVTTTKVSFKELSLTSLFKPLADAYGKKNVSAGRLSGVATLEGTGTSLQEMLGNANGKIGIGMEGGTLSAELLDLMGLDLFRLAGAVVVTGDKPIQMQCVIGDFGVTDGVMQPSKFLLVTDAETVQDKGQINLKDETMNMRVYVYPRKPSPLSLRSPIDIGGTLKNPKVHPDLGALALRGGAAAVLGLLAPPAAILAFLDPGMGKKSGCAQFLEHFNADKPSTAH